jgi:DnaJ-class molecular chaperone
LPKNQHDAADLNGAKAMSDQNEQTGKPLSPGDEGAPGTPGTGEDICPACKGSGKTAEGKSCPNCGGTGLITEGIGGG